MTGHPIAETGHKLGFPAGVIDALVAGGYDSFYPPQEEALRSGALVGRNLVLAIPTAAGKTLIAEICMVKSILEKGGRCLYIVPLRALASEKYEDLKKKYGPLGISTGIATGEYDMPGSKLAKFDILIATSEKVDSLLRLRTRWLAESLRVVVLDEVHYIHDPSRGPTLEIIAARLRQLNPSLQMLALSATISNGRELARWLDASLVSSGWRPVPLLEGVYWGNKIYYADHTSRSLVAGRHTPVEALVNDTIDEGGQALVFVSSRRSTIAAARALGPHVRLKLSPAEKKELSKIAEEAAGVLTEPTHICVQLAEAIRHGVAFHHAGLHSEQRRLVERAFRNNLVKAICATPTLAAGVNLPARRVVIRDWQRYEMGRGMLPIPVFEYKQFAGRAGRPGYDTEGEAILVAKKERDREFLFEEYVQAGTEPLRSRLGTGGALASHVLASVASGYAGSIDEMMKFLSLTFFALQEEVESLTHIVEKIMQFLLAEKMISSGGPVRPDFLPHHAAPLYPTSFGAMISQLYLDPRSGIILRDGLGAAAGAVPAPDALFHLICCCPDMDLITFGKGDYEPLLQEADSARHTLLITPPERATEAEEYRHLQALYTVRMIRAWITETSEEDITEEFGIGTGDLRRVTESADWLLYSAERIAGLVGADQIHPLIRELRRRVLYGIKDELLELVSLKGIGRVRARNLFRKGYRTLADIKAASVKKLSAVPTIGGRIAAGIKKQT